MKKLFGRKFVVAIIALVAGIVLAFQGKLDGQYVTLALGIVGAFSAADTAITRKSLAVRSTGSVTQEA